MADVYSLKDRDVLLHIEEREGGGVYLSIESGDQVLDILLDAVELANGLVNSSAVFTQGLGEIMERAILKSLLGAEAEDIEEDYDDPDDEYDDFGGYEDEFTYDAEDLDDTYVDDEDA